MGLQQGMSEQPPMQYDRTYSCRLPSELVERLDALTAQIDARTPMVRVRRSDVWRRALELGCEALELELEQSGEHAKK